MKTFTVMAVQEYQNAAGAVMDVHLQSEDGTRATLFAMPAICREEHSEKLKLLQAFKEQKFVIGEAGELPLTEVIPVKKKSAPRPRPRAKAK